jgi:hypothetical protein
MKAIKLALVGAILIFAIERSAAQTLRHPVLKSQSTHLQQQQAASLLSEFCSNMKVIAGIGLGCSTKTDGASFSDITDRTFHPVAALWGHFLGANSEDVLVQGWSAETHPYLWGGTLLLTKENGKWVPAWYMSALITDNCEKVTLKGGRQILLCEVEDGGMGHQFHYLYSVDARSPAQLRDTDTLLVQTDSFDEVGGCNAQRQSLDTVRWASDRASFSVVVHTSEFRNSLGPGCEGNVKRERPDARKVLRFIVGDRGFKIR